MTRRRLLVARTAVGAGALALLAGCTFLIDFEEVPRDAEAGADSAPPIGPPDVRVDSGLAPDARVDGSPDARGDALANPDACKGAIDGKYCGDRLPWPLEHKDDLITCKASLVSVVTPCGNGQGCLGMLDGYPDECDECAKKVDGTYCGRDFSGWDPKNAQQRIRCQGGRVVGSLLCTVCKSNGINSACQ